MSDRVGPLKIGLLVSSLHVSEINVELARWMAAEEAFDPSIVVLDASPSSPLNLSRAKTKHVFGGLRSAVWASRRTRVYSCVTRLREAIIRLRGATSLRRRPTLGESPMLAVSGTPLDSIIPVAHQFRPLVSVSGFVQQLSDSDLDTLRSSRYDVLLRLGNGILRGGILTASRHGILSFHHGDNRVNRGGPWGYWEVVNQESTTGFILQRLTDELDGGDVLARRNYRTLQTVAANRENIVLRSYPVLREVLLQLATTDRLPDAEPPFPYDGPLLRSPNERKSVRLLVPVFRGAASRRIRETPTLTWHVGVAPKPWTSVSLRSHYLVPTRPRTWVADPFLVEFNGSLALFVEEYLSDRGRGRISVSLLDEMGRPGLPEPVLEEDFHLSFPCTFTFGDHLYMTPESYEKREVRLYRCLHFPDQWEFMGTIVDKVAAVDPMVVHKDGKWFMLVNIDPLSMGDPNSELHVFCADNPIDGSWVPLETNPQVADPRQARNGGLLRDGEKLFRVGQVQSFKTYGASCSIYEVEQLDSERYSEVLRFPMAAKWAPGLSGPHHFSSTGSLTAFDYQIPVLPSRTR